MCYSPRVLDMGSEVMEVLHRIIACFFAYGWGGELKSQDMFRETLHLAQPCPCPDGWIGSSSIVRRR